MKLWAGNVASAARSTDKFKQEQAKHEIARSDYISSVYILASIVEAAHLGSCCLDSRLDSLVVSELVNYQTLKMDEISADMNVEIWNIKKLIKSLQLAKG